MHDVRKVEPILVFEGILGDKKYMLVRTARYSLALSLASLLPYCNPATSLAAPQSIVLDAALANGSKSLTVIFTPASSAVGCTYSLYGSPVRSKLATQITAATLLSDLTGASGRSVLQANSVKRLRITGKRAPRIYFRAQLQCPDGVVLSNIDSVRPKIRKKGGLRKASRWVQDLEGRFSSSTLRIARAFSNLSFQAPVDLQNAGDGTNRLFVVEQGGRIHVFENNPEVAAKILFLDIHTKVVSGGERGLLGLAFHPQYSSNGYFYVHYSKAGSGDTVIARYRVSSGNANVADPASELVILEVEQPYTNHNGGTIVFGPDGFLYIALGDGGSGGDPEGHGQNRQTLLGSILRIDVDNPANGGNYGIPSDNPFVGNTQGFKEEIYAYGLRNPWRISFDSQTGRLWAGDVGQGRREEVDIIENGKNYGWNIMEGSICYSPSSGCNLSGLTLPVTDYSHSVGSSITGGYVYRGTSNPSLIGLYVYADFISGMLWSLAYDGINGTNYDLFSTELQISSFGVDENRELYFLSYADGTIYAFSST